MHQRHTRKARALTLALTATALTGIAAVAYAADTQKVTSKALSNKTGSVAKPAAFTPSFVYTSAGPDGARAASPSGWTWSWNGVKINSADFPTCTAEKIDAAQSDASCPKGSLVATAPFEAVIGPEGQRTSNISCKGKVLRIYNAGPNKQAFFAVGPGAQCAGVGYLAPTKMTLKTVGNTTTTTFPFPENIAHPLPGIEAAMAMMSFSYKQLSTKVKGKTVHYMESTSCPTGKRTFTYTIHDTDGTHTVTADVGRCKK